MGPSLRVFCSRFRASICRVSMGRTVRNRSSRLTASRTCRETPAQGPSGGAGRGWGAGPVLLTWSRSWWEQRIMEATTSGRVSRGRLSRRRFSLATTGTDMSNMSTNCTQQNSFKPLPEPEPGAEDGAGGPGGPGGPGPHTHLSSSPVEPVGQVHQLSTWFRPSCVLVQFVQLLHL